MVRAHRTMMECRRRPASIGPVLPAPPPLPGPLSPAGNVRTAREIEAARAQRCVLASARSHERGRLSAPLAALQRPNSRLASPLLSTARKNAGIVVYRCGEGRPQSARARAPQRGGACKASVLRGQRSLSAWWGQSCKKRSSRGLPPAGGALVRVPLSAVTVGLWRVCAARRRVGWGQVSFPPPPPAKSRRHAALLASARSHERGRSSAPLAVLQKAACLKLYVVVTTSFVHEGQTKDLLRTRPKPSSSRLHANASEAICL